MVLQPHCAVSGWSMVGSHTSQLVSQEQLPERLPPLTSVIIPMPRKRRLSFSKTSFLNRKLDFALLFFIARRLSVRNVEAFSSTSYSVAAYLISPSPPI